MDWHGKGRPPSDVVLHFPLPAESVNLKKLELVFAALQQWTRQQLERKKARTPQEVRVVVVDRGAMSGPDRIRVVTTSETGSTVDGATIVCEVLSANLAMLADICEAYQRANDAGRQDLKDALVFGDPTQAVSLKYNSATQEFQREGIRLAINPAEAETAFNRESTTAPRSAKGGMVRSEAAQTDPANKQFWVSRLYAAVRDLDATVRKRLNPSTVKAAVEAAMVYFGLSGDIAAALLAGLNAVGISLSPSPPPVGAVAAGVAAGGPNPALAAPPPRLVAGPQKRQRIDEGQGEGEEDDEPIRGAAPKKPKTQQQPPQLHPRARLVEDLAARLQDPSVLARIAALEVEDKDRKWLEQRALIERKGEDSIDARYTARVNLLLDLSKPAVQERLQGAGLRNTEVISMGARNPLVAVDMIMQLANPAYNKELMYDIIRDNVEYVIENRPQGMSIEQAVNEMMTRNALFARWVRYYTQAHLVLGVDADQDLVAALAVYMFYLHPEKRRFFFRHVLHLAQSQLDEGETELRMYLENFLRRDLPPPPP